MCKRLILVLCLVILALPVMAAESLEESKSPPTEIRSTGVSEGPDPFGDQIIVDDPEPLACLDLPGPVQFCIMEDGTAKVVLDDGSPL